MIFCNKEHSLKEKLAEASVFLDNNALIALMDVPDFLDFFQEAINSGCQFLTIPAVVAEFSATDSLEKYNKRMTFLNDIRCAIYPIEKSLDSNDPLFFVFNKIGGSPGYVDVLLYHALYKFPSAFLLTGNHKDFPIRFFRREYTLTNDSVDKEIKNSCLYQINKDAIEEQISRLSRNIT